MAEPAEVFDPASLRIRLRSMRGGDYLDVKWRLVWLREEHPDAIIETEEKGHDPGKWATFRACVRIPNAGSASGHGSETAGDFPDYYEKSETKALGRALAALGYGAQFLPADDEALADSPVDRGGNKPTPINRPANRTVDRETGEIIESPPSKDDHQRAMAHFMAACANAGLQDVASKLFAIAGYPMRGDEPTTSRKQLTAGELDTLARNVKDWIPAVEYGEDSKTVISISVVAECANDIASATNQKRLAELAVKMKADGIAEKWLKAMWSTKNMQAPAAVESEPEQAG